MTVVAEVGDSEDSDEANKENNDPVHNMVETMFERSPDYFEKSFVSFCLEKNPNSIDFQNDMVLAFGLHSFTHDGLCNALTDNHYHVLAQGFGESHKGQH